MSWARTSTSRSMSEGSLLNLATRTSRFERLFYFLVRRALRDIQLLWQGLEVRDVAAFPLYSGASDQNVRAINHVNDDAFFACIVPRQLHADSPDFHDRINPFPVIIL